MVLGNIGIIAACESSNNIFVTSRDLPAPGGGVAVNRVGLTRSDWNFSISLRQSFNDFIEVRELVLYVLNVDNVSIPCLFCLRNH